MNLCVLGSSVLYYVLFTRYDGLLFFFFFFFFFLRRSEATTGDQGAGIADPVETEPLRATESRVLPPVQSAVPPEINYPEMAQKVYSLALGALAQLPQELTIADALTMARDRKTFVVPVIEAELRKLFE